MPNKAITIDAALRYITLPNSEPNVSCPTFNEKCRVSLIKTNVDICLHRENNEFRIISDIIISDDESDYKSCVGNCLMEIVFR